MVIFMDRDIYVNWKGVSILLPREEFKRASGSSLSSEKKEKAFKGGVPRQKKSDDEVKFFTIDTEKVLWSITMGVERLNKLAGITT